ncbi:MAG: hypothetical protein JJ897_08985 [Marinibacterium sp.]|nr:hypothetical protein [Marinibacterium sp.]
MKFTLFAAFLAASTAPPAFAGEQFVDQTGYAVSGYDVVAYRSLAANPVGQDQPEAIPGKVSITADYNGATFAFASKENRAKFLENPAYYVPQYDGHCTFGVSKGGKVPGNPNLWRIVDNKLYLNITTTVVGFWEEDIPGNINKAENNWVNIEDAAASSNPIPKWTSQAPAKN